MVTHIEIKCAYNNIQSPPIIMRSLGCMEIPKQVPQSSQPRVHGGFTAARHTSRLASPCTVASAQDPQLVHGGKKPNLQAAGRSPSCVEASAHVNTAACLVGLPAVGFLDLGPRDREPCRCSLVGFVDSPLSAFPLHICGLR